MIDVKETMEKIAALERLKAQVELRSNQIKEQERQLVEKLTALGVTPESLEKKIKEIEGSIAERMTHIKELGSDITAI